MKVVAFNGSPHSNGNTFQSLEILAGCLKLCGVETEIIQVGAKQIRGCMSCYKCFETQNEKCVISDAVNDCIQKAKQADGIILASPVYFAGLNGIMKSFSDRLFFVSHANGNLFRHKVGAAVVTLRRSGGIATFDTLNHYFQIAEMVIPSSNYWNIIHGRDPGEINYDTEGKQIIEVLAQNMAWLLKLIDHGKNAVTPPKIVEKEAMNFIRL